MNQLSGRVVVTGMGIVSCLGNDLETVSKNLHDLNSGIVFMPEQKELFFRSHVAGNPHAVSEASLARIPRKVVGNMSNGSLWNTLAALDALEQAGLLNDGVFADVVRSDRCGALMATGSGSTQEIYEAGLTTYDPKRLADGKTLRTPRTVSRTMASTNSAAIQWIGLNGPTATISSACASSAIAIGQAATLIQAGRCEVMLAGAGDSLDLVQTAMFDGMSALSSKRNGEPAKASRAFDADRDGFIIAGGGGCLVLESLEHALGREATIIAELAGFGWGTDGSMSASDPTVDGPLRAMRQALRTADGEVSPALLDYINVHGTSTKVGDLNEMKAIEEFLLDYSLARLHISSTKSLTGHPLGTAGVHEAIYTLLMMRGGFMAGSANLETLDQEIETLQVSAAILWETQEAAIRYALSNSFGFGGTNASLLFKRV